MNLKVVKSFNNGSAMMERQFPFLYSEIGAALRLAGPDAHWVEMAKYLVRQGWVTHGREARSLMKGRIKVDLGSPSRRTSGNADAGLYDVNVVVSLSPFFGSMAFLNQLAQTNGRAAIPTLVVAPVSTGELLPGYPFGGKKVLVIYNSKAVARAWLRDPEHPPASGAQFEKSAIDIRNAYPETTSIVDCETQKELTKKPLKVGGYSKFDVVIVIEHGNIGWQSFGPGLLNGLRPDSDATNAVLGAVRAGGIVAFLGCETGAGDAGRDYLSRIKGTRDIKICANVNDTLSYPDGGGTNWTSIEWRWTDDSI